MNAITNNAAIRYIVVLYSVQDGSAVPGGARASSLLIVTVFFSTNSGNWGYNNLQWQGITWFHKFDEKWHFGVELYHLSQSRVLNQDNAVAQSVVASGGYPFARFAYNAPNLAQCHDANVAWCTANAYASVMYLNYEISTLDNLSFRPEYYNDAEGQRTGTKATYLTLGLGWQHWFSPQVEIRPEVTYYKTLNGAPAFNGDANAGIAPTKDWAVIAAGDVIWHF